MSDVEAIVAASRNELQWCITDSDIQSIQNNFTVSHNVTSLNHNYICIFVVFIFCIEYIILHLYFMGLYN